MSAAFSYHDPRSVSDAVKLLGSLENAKLLAGGQSLMPMLNFRFVQPDHIIDLIAWTDCPTSAKPAICSRSAP